MVLMLVLVYSKIEQVCNKFVYLQDVDKLERSDKHRREKDRESKHKNVISLYLI